MKMKRILIAVAITAVATSAVHAFNPFQYQAKGSIAECRVVDGEYDNTIMVPGRIYLESTDGNPFDMASAKRLTVENILGINTVFQSKSLFVSGGTKVDFFSENTSSPIQAVLLVGTTPGQIRNKFNALLVIAGVNISMTADGGPLAGWSSLVYNLECEVK
jgi:hypothetical protein